MLDSVGICLSAMEAKVVKDIVIGKVIQLPGLNSEEEIVRVAQFCLLQQKNEH
jgi:hypothetical protein